MQVSDENKFFFQEYTLDLRRGCLRRGDLEVALRPKSFAVLRYLVENAGRLVSKDELIGAVWTNVDVADMSLARCVSDVRLALQDQEQRIIKTVPRRGYLFAVPVSLPPNESETANPPDATGPRQHPGEFRQLTVMACELSGLAALSARLDPEDLSEVTVAWYRRCTAVIERYHGYIVRTDGDGLIAWFGYPAAQEHDAERSVRSALVLQESTAHLSIECNTQLQACVGIATGMVMIGDALTVGAILERTAVGETLTLSLRLQALAEPVQIVISQGTRRLTGGLFEYRDLGHVALKGLAAPVTPSLVLSESAAESRFEAHHPTNLTPMVGREEEIELLLRRWRQAKGGEGSVVLLAGEAGIGKSRIARAVQELLSGEKHTRMGLFCSPHHQNSALWPSINQLERAAGFRREDTGEQRLIRLKTMVAEACGELGETVPWLAELLSVPTADRDPRLNLTREAQARNPQNTGGVCRGAG